MGLLSFIEANTKLSLFLIGATGLTGFSILSYSSSGEGKEATHLLKEVPEGQEGQEGQEVTLMDGKTFKSLTPAPKPFWELINGTTDYNSGNYVIYYGSEACPHCTGFLFGDQTLARGNLWLSRDKMSDGAWMKGYQFARTNKDLKDLKIKFLMYEDVPGVPKKSRNDATWALPWATWETTDLSTGKVQGEYKRHDKSAVNFRRIFEAAIKRFGEKVSSTPMIILYKNGIPAIFYHDQLPGLERKKQDESLSNDVEFKRYIYHYYKNIK